MSPAAWLLQDRSTFPVHLRLPAELVETGSAHLGPRSVVVIPSLSGTTKESVEALAYCKERGATVITLTGHADTPLARDADHSFVNFAEDDTSCESFYLQSESACTQARAAVVKTQADFDRASDLFAHDAMAKKEVLASENALAQAKGSLTQAEAMREQAVRRLRMFGLEPGAFGQKVIVRAPISGRILAINVVKDNNPQKGSSTISMKEAAEAAQREAADEVDQERVSKAAQNAVRDYFRSMEKENASAPAPAADNKEKK